MEEEPGAGWGLGAGGERAGAVEAGEKKPLPRPPAPRNCRKFARKELARALPEIVDAFVKEAAKGSVAHAKLLTSWSGLDKEPLEPVKVDRGKSMAALLNERLAQDPMLRARSLPQKKDGGGQAGE